MYVKHIYLLLTNQITVSVIYRFSQIILDPKLVGLRYARGWFVVDMVSSFPVDYVVLIFTSGQINNALLKASRALRVIRLVKLISLLKLLRISRLLRFMQRWEEVQSDTFLCIHVVIFAFHTLCGLVYLYLGLCMCRILVWFKLYVDYCFRTALNHFRIYSCYDMIEH